MCRDAGTAAKGSQVPPCLRETPEGPAEEEALCFSWCLFIIGVSGYAQGNSEVEAELKLLLSKTTAKVPMDARAK